MLATQAIERFWSKVDKNGPTMPGMSTCCWVWLGAKVPAGYGAFRSKRAFYYAHRIALELHLGRPLRAKALHQCDHPSCCNPEHLYEGTDKHNAEDRERRGRGRQPKGERNFNAKLTAAIVAEIRETHQRGGATTVALGKRFGVGSDVISQIINRKAWKHVP